MTLPLTFTVPGQPKGKGRARFTRAGHAYTPAGTRAYEAQVRAAAVREMAGRAPTSGAVAVTIQAHVAIPPSWPKHKQQAALRGEVKPTGRVDLDNFVKIALDGGLNKTVIVDDSQVVRIVAEKRYALSPELIVTVRAA